MKRAAPIGKTQFVTASLLLLGALSISACSLAFQYFGGYQPCELCYIQRYVHYSMIPASILTLLIMRFGAPAILSRLCMLALAALLLYGAGVGVYQAGAEWEFWRGPNCSSTVAITNDVSNLLGQLQNTKLVSCTVAQLRILGLSFGGWNAVLSSILFAIAMIGTFASRDMLTPLLSRLPLFGNIANQISNN